MFESIHHLLYLPMAVLADIQTALAALQDADPVEQIVGAMQIADQLHAFAGAEALRMQQVGRIHQDGLSNPGHWLAHKAKRPKHRGRQIVENARLLERFPIICQGISDGVLSEDHLTVLKKCLPRNRTPFRAQQFDTDHKLLVDVARNERFDDFRFQAYAWIGLCEDADPDAKAPEEQDLHLDLIDNKDGTTTIRGLLLTSDAETLRAGLSLLAEKAKESERLAQKREQEAAADQQDVEVAEPEIDDLSVDYSISEYTLRPVIRKGLRYWKARSVGMLATLANSAPVGGKTPDPLVVIMMDWDTFNEEKDRWATNGSALSPDTVFRPGYDCQTLDGEPVSPQEAFRAALNGRVARCVVDAESRKVDLGRTSRLFTGAAREAIIWRDRNCQTPGCGAPARWGEVDHIQEWQDLGPTNSSNGELRCGPCHKSKTQRQLEHRQRQRNSRPDLDDTEPF